MTDSTYTKGVAGEERAIAYLQSRGMVLLERRYRSPFGEIDAIFRDGDAIAFVEVKARSSGGRGSGLMAVGKRKQQRITLTARQYVAEHACDCVMRFDVLELTRDGVLYIPNAFEAREY